MMLKEQLFFLNLLSDYINGKKTVLLDGMDISQLISISKQQQCEGIVYYQTHFSEFRQLFALNSYYAVNRLALLKNVHEQFSINHIPYILFKGMEVAQLYHVSQLRTMGDSDILVHEEDKLKAHEILLSLGFVNECLGPNEWIYNKGSIKFELHHRLMNDELVSSQSHKDFMETVWDHSNTDDGIQYHIDWTFHLVFLLLHLRKHLMNCGVGFRQFMDVAIVTKNCDINWANFLHAINELQIVEFVSICYALIQKWFGMEAPFDVAEIDGSFYEIATKSIFDNGVFGFNNKENSNNYSIIRMGEKNTFFGKTKILIDFLTPSYRDMCSVPQYAFIKGRKWLLPIAWMYRFLYSALHGIVGKRLRIIHKRMDVTEDQRIKRKQYLHSWGLKID